MDIYSNAIEARDVAKIEKLNKITSLNNFWGEVRKLTKNVYSDHSLSRWQILAETRERELKAAEQDKPKDLQAALSAAKDKLKDKKQDMDQKSKENSRINDPSI